MTDSVREMAGQIGRLSGILETFCKSQEQTNARLLELMESHEKQDDVVHLALGERIGDMEDELKTAKRLAFGIATGAGLVSGTGAGWLAKIAGLFKV